MSWLERSLPPGDRDEEEPIMSNAIEKLIVSRTKSIAVLNREIEEYRAQASKFAVGAPARLALEAVAEVKAQRKTRLEAELAGFRQAAADPAQLEVPTTRSSSSSRK